MSSNSVCNHTRDQQIRLPLRGRPILLVSRIITDRIGLHSVLLPLLSYFSPVGASGSVRIDRSGDRSPDYSLKYYVNGSFQGIADYNHTTGGFNMRGKDFDH